MINPDLHCHMCGLQFASEVEGIPICSDCWNDHLTNMPIEKRAELIMRLMEVIESRRHNTALESLMLMSDESMTDFLEKDEDDDDQNPWYNRFRDLN